MPDINIDGIDKDVKFANNSGSNSPQSGSASGLSDHSHKSGSAFDYGSKSNSLTSLLAESEESDQEQAQTRSG